MATFAFKYTSLSESRTGLGFCFGGSPSNDGTLAFLVVIIGKSSSLKNIETCREQLPLSDSIYFQQGKRTSYTSGNLQLRWVWGFCKALRGLIGPLRAFMRLFRSL